jgi:hypothetical protein
VGVSGKLLRFGFYTGELFFQRSMMTTRFTLIFFFMAAWVGSSFGQQRQILIEEIQKKPENLIGDWVIGGKKLTTDESSKIGSSELADIGSLIVVEYVVKDNQAHITQMQPQPFKAASITDGPYVNWIDPTTVEVITINQGKLKRQVITDITEPRELKNLTPLVKTVTLDPKPPTPPKSQWDAPQRLLAISDLEGNYLHALRFLQNNHVLDEDGHWDWGNGHLVLVGDLVDRGQSVAEVMWLMRRLEREAESAGGRVHYVLGNHEAMVMAGDLRYIHLKYHFTSTRIGMSYDQLHGPKSEIGRWWRSRNGVTCVGNLLFVHGGYSPELDQANLDMDELNQLIRAGLPPARPTGKTAATNPVGHQHGPFWYRGYFQQHAADWGGLASQKEIARILDRHKAKHIVIGHTVVDEVGPIDEFGTVIGIDVKWADSTKCQGLLQEDGKLYRLTMTGEREEILAGVEK